MSDAVLVALIGGVTAAFVSGLFGIVMWILNRKAKKEDRAYQQAASICSARGDELRELKRQMGVVMLADRTILYDRIKHLAKSYITQGHVTVEELEDLNMMHSVYHDKDKLDGNGFLDNLMHTVNNALEIRAK